MNICVAIFLVVYMMYLAHTICKQWLLLPMRHRFFITYSVFFAVLYCVVVMVVFYQAYGYSEVQTLTTLVLWNFYVFSLQYAWGRSETVEGAAGSGGPIDMVREDGERRYFDSQYEVELSKGEGRPHRDLIDPSRQLHHFPEGADNADLEHHMHRLKADKATVFPDRVARDDPRLTVNTQDLHAPDGKGFEWQHKEDWHNADTDRGPAPWDDGRRTTNPGN